MTEEKDCEIKVGDSVWVVRTGQRERWVTCKECFGKLFVTVILGDDSRVTLECDGCKRGYHSPNGLVREYDSAPTVEQKTITEIRSSVKTNGTEFEYIVGGSWCFKAVYTSEREAKAAAEELRVKEEEDAKTRKYRSDKKWSWNASYHRERVRDAERDLKYHSEMLAVAEREAKKNENKQKVQP